MLSTLNPTVFFIEETKMTTGGRIKTENSQKYQIFELVRQTKTGGGIAIGALADVEPVLLSEGNDNVEVLVIEIIASGLKIRCVCGYGPQENHCISKKNDFLSRLSVEVEDANDNDAAVIIQMDGNMWAGPEVIKNDPHQCNQNGKLLKNFIENFPHLCLVNSLDICQGLITRRRKTVRGNEESVLDVFIVCKKILPFVKRMIVDEDQNYTLSNYRKRKGEYIVKKSDHNPVILELDINYIVKKPDRIETFNFRNKECQEHFFDITNTSNQLSKCFQKDGNFATQAGKWFKTLNGTFHKAFRKIRHTNKKKPTEVSEILGQRREIIKKMKNCSEEESECLQDALNKIEDKVCDMIADKNHAKIVDNFKSLTDQSGLLNTQGMWNIKRKVFPKNKESLPYAKKTCDGKIVTSQSQIKTLYLDTFVHRLRHRPIKEDFEYLKSLKENLCRRRLAYAEKQKTDPWTQEQLMKILSNLKNDKARDPHGLVNELFKPGVIGQDLFDSLLYLLNQTKHTLTVPKFMELCSIVAIYKGKGEKSDLQNDRGIFLVNIFRAILMKLVYKDKYDIVDSNMSDSNVGARKKKNIRNHIYVLNGIINEAIKKKDKPVDLVIVDYKQCFDSLWLEECINDLFEAGIMDEKLALIYKLNSVNQVAVRTPFGLTEKKQVEKIVLQGEVLGPLECSVTVDTFGKECLEEEKHLFLYRGKVGVPPLAMVDDVACPAYCGLDTVEVAAYINAKTNVKKLQFGVDKCHQLHFGTKKHLCPDLHIDSWGLKKNDEEKTGLENLDDVHLGQYKIESVEEEKYLGDIISSDGSNLKNVVARKNKSIGILKQISSILEETCYGEFHFEVAVMLRDSLLLNSILTNSEAWYQVKPEEIEILEKCDESLLRNFFEAPCTTPKCMLYLESGCKPIRFTIMTRRVMYLHYILNEDENTLISRFFHAQNAEPYKDDWSAQVCEDLCFLEIYLTFEQIKKSSREQFKKLVDESIHVAAFKYLLEQQKKSSKVLHIKYKDLEMQKYLKSKEVNKYFSKFTFSLRSRMLDVAANYPNKSKPKMCPLCKDSKSDDSQEHILNCAKLNENEVIDNSSSDYRNLFDEDVTKQLQISRIIESKYKRRKKLIRESSQQEKPSEPSGVLQFSN